MTRQQEFRETIAYRGPAVFGGCTRETARCADARDYNVDLRDCCRGHIRQLVVDTVAALREFGFTFWADYGTLLGAVRNPLLGLAPGIIPHDKDADFSLLSPGVEQMRRLQRYLESRGYYVVIRPLGRSLKVRLSRTNHTNLDCFVWRERAGGVLARDHYIAVDQYKGRDFPKAWLSPMATVEWEGVALPAPADPAAFCEFRYGPGWMTPIRANHDGQLR